LTDPDPNLLKSAAAYLIQVARSSKGGRYRKSAKIEALRECKEEILEAHRSGISIHRIAQIFRERNVDISTQHLMRAIRLFIAEGEGAKARASAGQERREGSGAAEEKQRGSVKYQISDQPVAMVREEEFAKQLRLARYLAGASLPAARPLEPVLKGRAPKQERSVPKARSKPKAEPVRQKAGEAELAKERRRAGRVARQKRQLSGRPREEKGRSGPGR
jgi:hypothetical protein